MRELEILLPFVDEETGSEVKQLVQIYADSKRARTEPCLCDSWDPHDIAFSPNLIPYPQLHQYYFHCIYLT